MQGDGHNKLTWFNGASTVIENNLFTSIWTGKEFELREIKIHHQDSTIVRVIGSGLCGTDRHLMKLPAFNEQRLKQKAQIRFAFCQTD